MPLGIKEVLVAAALISNGMGQHVGQQQVQQNNQLQIKDNNAPKSVTQHSYLKELEDAALYVPEVAIGAVANVFIDTAFPRNIEYTLKEKIEHDKGMGETILNQASNALFSNQKKEEDERIEQEKDDL